MVARRGRTAGLAACIGALGCVLTGCSHDTPGRTVTVTVDAPVPTPSGTTPLSTPVSGAAPTTTATAPGSTPPNAATMTKLPGRCNGLLPLDAVDNVLNRTVHGKTAFVVGVAEADIGRLGYLNCRYGLTSANATPAVEIGVSVYRTAARAQARIAATVNDYESHGARASDVQVGQLTGRLLTGGSGTGYDAATLVLAAGQRTIAVSVAGPAATGGATKSLTALAALAERRTAG